MAGLPEGWEARNFDGKIVYINHAARVTQWEWPDEAAATHDVLKDPTGKPRTATMSPYVAEVQGPARSPSPIPRNGNKYEDFHPGWRKERLSNGQTLYVNFRDKTTSWDPPMPTEATAAAHGSSNRPNNGRRPADTCSSPYSTPSTGVRTDPKGRTRRPNDGSRAGGRDNNGVGSHNVDLRVGEPQRMREPDSPLPEGWRKAYTKSGKPYYRNDRDQIRRWDKPAATETPESRHGYVGTGGGTHGKSGNRGSTPRERTDQNDRRTTAGPRQRSPANRNGGSHVDSRHLHGTERVGGQRVREPGSPIPDGGNKTFIKSVKVYYRDEHDRARRRGKPASPREQRRHRERSKTPTEGIDLHYRTNYDQTVTWEKLMEADGSQPRRPVAGTENGGSSSSSSDSGQRSGTRSGAGRDRGYPDASGRRTGPRVDSRANESSRGDYTIDPRELGQSRRVGAIGSPVPGAAPRRSRTPTRNGELYLHGPQDRKTGQEKQTSAEGQQRYRGDAVAGNGNANRTTRSGTGRQGRSRTREPHSRSGAHRMGSNSGDRTGGTESGNGRRAGGPTSPLPKGAWASSSSS
ncbi:unnamed protein product, partial [Scytosiphon promiscuus]